MQADKGPEAHDAMKMTLAFTAIYSKSQREKCIENTSQCTSIKQVKAQRKYTMIRDKAPA